MGASDRPQPGTHSPTSTIQLLPCCCHTLHPHRHSSRVLAAMITWPADSYDRVRHKHLQRLTPCRSHTHTSRWPPAGPDLAPTILTTHLFPQAPPPSSKPKPSPHWSKGHSRPIKSPARPGTAVLCQEFVCRRKPATQGRSGPGAQFC